MNGHLNIDTAKKLLNRSVNISQHGKYGIVNSILEQEKQVPESWRKNPLLRHHYLLFFDNNGIFFGHYELTLSQELGLTIKKNKLRKDMPNFNLVTEKWIPIIRMNGRMDSLGATGYTCVGP